MDIYASAFCVENNEVYIMHGKLNAFFKYNLITGEMEYIDSIPNEELVQESMYLGVHKYKHKLVFIPCWGSRIMIYDINTREFREIQEEKKRNGRFIYSYIQDNMLICIPFYEDYILKIDLDGEFVTNKIGWKKNDFSDSYINKSFWVGETLIMVVPNARDKLLVFDGDKVTEVLLGNKGLLYTSGCYVNGKIYLYSMETMKIYEYEKDTYSCIREFYVYKKEKSGLSQLGNRWMLQENGYNGDRFLVQDNHYIDYSKKRIKTSIFNGNCVQGICRNYEKRFFYYDLRDSFLYEIDCDGNYKRFKMSVDIDTLKNKYSPLFLKKEICDESEIVGLKELIETI